MHVRAGLCQPVFCAKRVSRLTHRSGAVTSFPAFPLLGNLSLDWEVLHPLGKIWVFQESRDFLKKLFFSESYRVNLWSFQLLSRVDKYHDFS